MSTDLVVVKLTKARTALTEARTLQEAKRIADVATAAKVYAQRQKLGRDAVLFATAVILEAERRIGQMLKTTPRHRGGKPVKNENRFTGPLSLADLGIDRKTSSRAQRLADLDDDIFDRVKEGALPIGIALRQSRPDALGHGCVVRPRPDPGKLQIRKFDPWPRLIQLCDALHAEMDFFESVTTREATS